MAHRLGAKGVSLVLVARRADRLEAIAQQYRNVEVLIADLETPEGVARVVARIGDVTRAPIDLPARFSSTWWRSRASATPR